MSSNRHGAQPVPVGSSAASRWIPRVPTELPSEQLGPWSVVDAPRRVPEAPDGARAMAQGTLTTQTVVPVVGVEGGAGRTTVTRLVGRAAVEVRGATATAAVDAVPLWGGLTAAVVGHGGSCLTVDDIADMTWPPDDPVEEILAGGFALDGALPTLMGGPSPWAGSATALGVATAVRRLAGMVEVVLVDTVADPLSSPVGELVTDCHTTPIWVCTATRAGIWGAAEAINYLEKCMAGTIVRSVIAVVGHRRWWPAEAKAAEMQLVGSGYEVIRVPFASDPLRSQRCAEAAVRLLAGIVTRSC